MKRSFAFAFVGACLASGCSGSESGGAPAPLVSSGGSADASVASGGNATSSGGRSTGTGGRSTGGGGASSSTGGRSTGSGGASSSTGGGGTTSSTGGNGGASAGTGGSGAADASSGSGGTSGSGGAGGGSGGNGTNDSGSGSCGTETCTASEVCVAYRTIGGGLIYPTDAGKCPPGSHVEPGGPFNSHCAADYRYQCVPLVGCAGADVRCSCATGTCPSQFFSCSNPSPATIALDPVAQLICQQLAP